MAIEVPMFRADSFEDTRYAIFFVGEILAVIQAKETQAHHVPAARGLTDRRTALYLVVSCILVGAGPRVHMSVITTE